jgi:hypothetical protein
MKIRRADHTSIGKYKGSAHFSELENWVTNLVVMLEAIQYGGNDCDRERLLCIPVVELVDLTPFATASFGAFSFGSFSFS